MALTLAGAALVGGCAEDPSGGSTDPAPVVQDPDVEMDAGISDDVNVVMDVMGDVAEPDTQDNPPTDAPVVFVSSSILSGDSVQDVNAICKGLADDAGLVGSSWIAWVSTATRDIKALDFGDGPWHRMDGALVFESRAALFAGSPKAPINLDEQGNEIDALVFTGTTSEGKYSGETCRNWRSYYEYDDVTLGHTASTDTAWTAAEVSDCGTSRRVYCFQDTSSPLNDKLSLVSQWNELMLAAVRRSSSRPTVTSRRLFIVSAAMYDAWAAYHPTARPWALLESEKRPTIEHTLENQEAAVSHAAYHALVAQFPDYEEASGHFLTMLKSLGHEPAQGASGSSPAALGSLAASRALERQREDGSGAPLFREQLSELYPETYQPANSANPSQENAFGGPAFDPNRWTPLRVPTGVLKDAQGLPMVDHDDDRTYTDQTFVTPHWGALTPVALMGGDQFRPSPPPALGSEASYVDGLGQAMTADEAFRRQFSQLVEISANLSQEDKVIAEFWADGPRTESPPGHWNQLAHGISTRDGHGVEQDVKMYFALNAAMFDAGIACWDAKRAYDFIRPVTAIHVLFGNERIEAWAGPDLGTRTIDGLAWRPYQDVRFVTPSFAEYVSGHSAFSAAAAETLKRFTGSDQLFDGTSRTVEDIDGDGEDDLLGRFVQQPFSSTFESVPTTPVVLTWETFTAAAEQAGHSRLLGGIHIQDGDLRGRQLGRSVGQWVFERVEAHWR